MTKAEYLEQIKSDIKDYIDENKIVVHDERGRESLYNKLWVSDSVTGNASGSYTCNDYQAKQNVKDIIFEDETLDMFREFGYERIPLEKGAEFLDVSIRCFLLSEALDSVLNEMEQQSVNLVYNPPRIAYNALSRWGQYIFIIQHQKVFIRSFLWKTKKVVL